jgi:hypothetical protein
MAEHTQVVLRLVAAAGLVQLAEQELPRQAAQVVLDLLGSTE